MPRKQIDFSPNLPSLPDDATAHRPIVSDHRAPRRWPVGVIVILILVLAAAYIWFV